MRIAWLHKSRHDSEQNRQPVEECSRVHENRSYQRSANSRIDRRIEIATEPLDRQSDFMPTAFIVCTLFGSMIWISASLNNAVTGVPRPASK